MTHFKKIKTGVIGAGSMGKNHIRVYSKISNLVGISDINKVQGAKIANKYNTTFFEDYRDMLNEVDAVSIAVPTKYHKQVCEEVASSGTHILIEKPLSDNLQDSEKIINIAKKNNIKLAVGHIERHNPIVKFAQKAIYEGNWSKPFFFSARRFSPFPNRISDVGVTFDLSVHDIDVITSLADSDVKAVSCFGHSYCGKGFEDHVSIQLQFKNSVTAICETSWLTPKRVRDLTIVCKSHYVVLDYLNQEIIIDSTDNSGEIISEKISVPKEESLMNEITDFLLSLNREKNPKVSGLDGYKVIKVAEAALESLGTGKIINL